MDRRTFLKGLAVLSAGTVIPSVPALAGSKSRVALAKAKSPGLEGKLVRGALEALGGIGKFVKAGSRVVLKPNMSFYRGPNSATTTNPAVVLELAQLCISAGAKSVMIVDHTLWNPDECLTRSGIRDAVAGLKGVRVIAINTPDMFETLRVPHGKILKSVQAAKVLSTADVLINLPVAKHHVAARLSLGMKNLLGLVWDRKPFHRLGLNQCIADLSSAMRPDLTIIDGTRILLTKGPSAHGRVEDANIIVAGIDPVAVDAVGVEITENWGGVTKKWTGRMIPHIVKAAELGLGQIDTSQVQILRIEV